MDDHDENDKYDGGHQDGGGDNDDDGGSRNVEDGGGKNGNRNLSK